MTLLQKGETQNQGFSKRILKQAQVHQSHYLTEKCAWKIPDAPPFVKYKHKYELFSEEINKLLMI